MRGKVEESKTQRVEELVARLERRLGGDEAAAATDFLRRYCASVAADDVLEPPPEHVLEAALSLWRFGELRRPGKPLVRLLNPTLEGHGWPCPHSVLEVVHDDMPFLVTSISAAINLRGRRLHMVAHPVLRVERDADGRRTGLLPDGAGDGPVESYIHLELDQVTDPEKLARLCRALEEVLADVRSAVEDWRPMTRHVEEAAAELRQHPAELPSAARREALEFLHWVHDHFIFLGYREYRLVEEQGHTYLKLEPESGLGILRRVEAKSLERGATPLTPAAAAHARRREPLFITKTYDRSTVHRAAHMDYIGVRRFSATGEAMGEHRFIGLFTSSVYDDSVRHLPLVRDKVERVVRRSGFAPEGHDAMAVRHIFETLPRDELFQITDDELYDLALGILRLQERQRLALFVRMDPFERFVSCLVYTPRDRFNTRLRERMKEILAAAFNGDVGAFEVRIGDSPLARAHFIVRTRPGEVPEYDVAALEERLSDAARHWGDKLRESLVETFGEEQGLDLLARYETASPAAYRERFDPEVAVDDIRRLEEVTATGELRLRLYRPPGAAPHQLKLKLYSRELRLLSDVVPMLENMGLKVVSEVPYEVRTGAPGGPHWLLDFELVTADGAAVELEATWGHFQDTLTRVWYGEVENDGFNRLVLGGLSWRQAVVLRAYARYLRQIGFAFSQAYIEDTLARNPEPARLLLELFAARFDPASQGDPETSERVAAIQGRIRRALNAVQSLDEDRILRRYLNLIRATVRTNAFQPSPGGEPKPYLSVKLDSSQIARLPQPRPAYEVFVYSPRVEAVHLRGGKVARGGIRWSDRPEDFRTEILGLMKAQMVKNAVIVPVGAKGGFIVKRPPAEGGREALQAEAVACYQTMIHGMLDLTDNLVEGEVAPPPDVVRHDGDDPYLVVAADKGTARFSDIANGVAAEHRFWLGDAFASGGSAGYDHKAMGITARGAWESVQRHFRELGVDVQRQPFSVVGIGDMSGDVFGNGMLLSEHIRLIGAFNHLHVFVDPDPDPAASHGERRRLFELPRSSWSDYDPAVISTGGGVFERSAKSVPLSPEIRHLLGVEAATMTPDELVQALLRAPVDLLWFGGIGTFVKASDESHAEAGDHFNDEVRVDAAELRAKVVGEGANLALTQPARIEYALGGGRINTDAIDNSAGVDTSDHEVNIKILLDDAIAQGELADDERDPLLAAMTGEVAALVLHHNYLQTQAITIAEAEGAGSLEDHARMMRALERAGRLSRQLESLPDDETLAERREAGRGLTRPELAVLLAYGKLWLYQEILTSPLPDDPELAHDLALYFPQPLRQRFAGALGRHRLRREIIATHLTNSMVNRVGPNFVFRLSEETGAPPTAVARAYTIGRDAFELREVWAAIEELDNRVPAALQMRMTREVGRLLDRITVWFLRNAPESLDVAARVAEFRPGARAVRRNLEAVLPAPELGAHEERAAGYRELGVPDGLARSVAAVDVLSSVCDIVAIARDCDYPVVDVAGVYFALGSRFSLDWLRQRAAALGDSDPWHKAAADAMVLDLLAHQGAITRKVLSGAAGEVSAEQAADAWLAAGQARIERLTGLVDELRQAGEGDLTRLTVASHQLRLLAST